MSEPVGAAPDTGDAGPSFVSEIGEMFGDILGGDDSSSSTSDAAGTPPAERQDAPGQTPEGEAAVERTGDTPADAATQTPDTQGLAQNAEADPLATATPFTYNVNGETRTFDGIKRIGEHGAIVAPEALQLLERRLGERDHLFEQSQAQYQRYSSLEKLTEWQTRDSSGKDVTLTGRDGIEGMRVTLARQGASLEAMASLFARDPLAFVVQDAEGRVSWNMDAVKELTREARVAERERAFDVRSRMAELSPRAPQPSAPAALTPESLTQLAPEAVTLAARTAGVANLTPKSQTFLAQLAPRYIRQATPEDIRSDPTLRIGQAMVDASFAQVVKGVAEQQAEAVAGATAAQAAARRNEANLAAAARGQRTVVKSNTPVAQPDERADNSGQAFSNFERAASRASRSGALMR